MLHWWPRIQDVLPAPKTEIFRLTDDQVWDIIGLLDGKPLPKGLAECLTYAARKSVGFPLFLRTDQGSAKHSYAHSCFVEKETDLQAHLATLIEWHLMRDLWPQAIVFRELLQLNAPFKAFEGLPIAKERRYFVDDGKVMCHHPYWQEGAIETGRRLPELPSNWKKMLEGINQESEEEVALLTGLAEEFAGAVPGFYSVDFAQKADGQWVLIDAARGELSWHPEHAEDA